MSRLRGTVVALAVALGGALGAPPALGQSVTGTQGLLTIPTARMHPDGTLVAGAGYVDRAFSTYQGGTQLGEGADYVPIYASVTFLPSVELGFRFSRAVRTDTPQALGDRMFLVRVRLLEERGVLPAVAIGAHDFLRSSENPTNFFHALYGVASKRVELGGALGRAVPAVDLHLGWGTDTVDAPGYQFVGVFGGAAVTLIQDGRGVVRGLDLLAEYDGRTVSVGPRLDLLGAVTLTAGVQGLEVPVLGVAVRSRL